MGFFSLFCSQPSTEQLSEYTRRIELLSGIINAEKLVNSFSVYELFGKFLVNFEKNNIKLFNVF